MPARRRRGTDARVVARTHGATGQGNSHANHTPNAIRCATPTHNAIGASTAKTRTNAAAATLASAKYAMPAHTEHADRQATALPGQRRSTTASMPPHAGGCRAHQGRLDPTAADPARRTPARIPAASMHRCARAPARPPRANAGAAKYAPHAAREPRCKTSPCEIEGARLRHPACTQQRNRVQGMRIAVEEGAESKQRGQPQCRSDPGGVAVEAVKVSNKVASRAKGEGLSIAAVTKNALRPPAKLKSLGPKRSGDL